MKEVGKKKEGRRGKKYEYVDVIYGGGGRKREKVQGWIIRSQRKKSTATLS